MLEHSEDGLTSSSSDGKEDSLLQNVRTCLIIAHGNTGPWQRVVEAGQVRCRWLWWLSDSRLPVCRTRSSSTSRYVSTCLPGPHISKQWWSVKWWYQYLLWLSPYQLRISGTMSRSSFKHHLHVNDLLLMINKCQHIDLTDLVEIIFYDISSNIVIWLSCGYLLGNHQLLITPG